MFLSTLLNSPTKRFIQNKLWQLRVVETKGGKDVLAKKSNAVNKRHWRCLLITRQQTGMSKLGPDY
jgi:hypothetical protein